MLFLALSALVGLLRPCTACPVIRFFLLCSGISVEHALRASRGGGLFTRSDFGSSAGGLCACARGRTRISCPECKIDGTLKVPNKDDSTCEDSAGGDRVFFIFVAVCFV